MSLATRLDVNPENWREVYTETFTSAYADGKQVPVYKPIPKTALGLRLTLPVIAVYAHSPDYFVEDKRRLGSVIQVMNTALKGSQLTTTAESFYNNQVVLVTFDYLVDEYDLLINVNYQVENLELTVYEYTGTLSNAVADRLLAVEVKLDELASKVGSECSGSGGGGTTYSQNGGGTYKASEPQDNLGFQYYNGFL